MARFFPTYIHHIETEAKSKGEFIIRTIPPRFITKVIRDGKNYSFEKIEQWDQQMFVGMDEESKEMAFKPFADDLNRWFKHRIENYKPHDAVQIFENAAKENMLQWNGEGFKRTHPHLYKTIIEAINQAKK